MTHADFMAARVHELEAALRAARRDVRHARAQRDTWRVRWQNEYDAHRHIRTEQRWGKWRERSAA